MKHRLIFVGLIGGMLFAASASATPSIDKNQPVLMQADQLGYDQEQSIVVAVGNVEVSQGSTKMLADRITYYQNYQVVRADGNVSVTDETGETYYADQVQLQDDLKAGVIGNFRVRMADNSQFVAQEASKESESITKLKQAAYTPCKVCQGKSPFWQMSADKVEINEEKQKIYYKNLTLRMMGIPVAYTPYFFHPTPGVGPESGILKPEYSRNSNLGTIVRLPYYINIAPDKDATLTPIYTTGEGEILEGEYRQKFDSGQIQFNGSITDPIKRDSNGNKLSGSEVRGHIFATGEYGINEHWGTGFDIRRSTDDTYLNKYKYGNYKSLDSRVYADGVYGRSYASFQGLAFQGLQATDDPAREPYVLPLAEGYYESDPGWRGARWFGSANTQVVTRDIGDKSRRLSVTSGMKLPMASDGGQLFDAEARLRSDAYSVEDVTLANGQSFDGETVRMIPQASVKWRYPLIKRVSDTSLTVEPTVLAVASSSGNNPDKIPNEDNRIVEFSDEELFSTDRFPGLDTVEEGERVAYGLRGEWLFNDNRNLKFLFGQNYSSQTDTLYPYNSNPDENFSDYIGRTALTFNPFSVTYRFRLDQDNLQPNSNAVSFGFDDNPVNFRLDYVTLNNDAYLQDKEEIMSSMAIALSDEWSINGMARRDLQLDQMIYAGSGLTYHNECFTLLTRLSRQYTRDRDVEPDTSFTVRVSFKNLNGL